MYVASSRWFRFRFVELSQPNIRMLPLAVIGELDFIISFCHSYSYTCYFWHAKAPLPLCQPMKDERRSDRQSRHKDRGVFDPVGLGGVGGRAGIGVKSIRVGWRETERAHVSVRVCVCLDVVVGGGEGRRR